MSLLATIKKSIQNIPGWKTDRKLVIIESDDWGNLGMPNEETYQKLLSVNIRVDRCKYATYDSLESGDDLTALLDVLNSVRDSNHQPAKITANTIVTNPDMEAIGRNQKTAYASESFTTTYKRFRKCDQSLSVIRQGMEEGLYQPQFHGREHVNIARWMNGLKKQLPETTTAFDQGFFALSEAVKTDPGRNYLVAFDFDSEQEQQAVNASLAPGLKLFEETFKFRSTSFIASGYTWHQSLEPELRQGGVSVIQGNPYQREPIPGGYRKVRHIMGEQNAQRQCYLVRNAYYEPTLLGASQAVESCLWQVSMAFRWGKPAVIGSHRLNYIGSLKEKNRTVGLAGLKELLQKIVTKWPDVEFMSSDQLGALIYKEKA